MLLNSDSVYTEGPPPQEVLDKRWLWKVYSALLMTVFVLRIVGGDIAGAVINGLMLCFVMVMLRDGMSDMPKYLVAYGILCVLNFVLDVVPLVTALGGRVSRTTEPLMVRNENGVQQMTYMLTKRTTPFFSLEGGLIYNLQSLAMLLCPVTMLMGCALSFLAHCAFGRHNAQDGGGILHNRQSQMQDAFAAVRRMSNGEASIRSMQGVIQGVSQPSSGAGSTTASSASTSRRSGERDPTPRESFERFTGRSFKL
mmetsp:Transcript_108971/g.339601  ORF Transcript_108971/g.339601 Transcript_108971/m.339601 type:complete len:254 (+) Transcript_108971:76-837(+)